MFKDMVIYTDEYKNGFRLSEMGAILTKESSIDLIPNRSIGTGSAFGRPGSYKGSITLGYRTIKPVIHFSPEEIPPDSPFKYYTLDELDDFLTRLFINNYKEFEVEFIELSGRFYKAYFDSSQTPKFYSADGEVSYVLTCYDPLIYGDSIQRLIGQEASSTSIDCSDAHKDTGIVLTVPSGQAGTFYWKHGGITTPVTVNPGLSNTGILTLNTLDRTLENPAGDNLLPSYASEFPLIPAGDINEFYTTEANLLLTYRKRYLY